MPAERTKTLTALANAAPLVGIHAPRVQSLQWFLAESPWDAAALNARRVDLLRRDAATAPDAAGVLVRDETGDRKWGTKTAPVGRQYLGSSGKVDRGVATVGSLWADERGYGPLTVEPCTPKQHCAKGISDPEELLDRPQPIVFAICQDFQQLADGTISLLSIYDRMMLTTVPGAAGPETVTVGVFAIETGAQGTFTSIVRVRDDDGQTIAEVRSDFTLVSTSERHYVPCVLIIPAHPGVYTATIGHEEQELLRQDFTLEIVAPAAPAQ